MKITRSSKTTIKFATEKKRQILDEIHDEYSKVVNIFIEMFWLNDFSKNDLKKDIISVPGSWLSARMRQCAATEGKCIGIDVGINHLLATSEGHLYGSEIIPLIRKIRRKCQGSKAYKRAKKTLSYYLHKVIKEQLDWSEFRLVAVEKLKNLKLDGRKNKNRSKEFRKTLSNWNYREVLNIIRMRSEENRVSFGSVNPYKTSQTCPACSHAERGNRISENFKCLKCGYSGQADIVGSLNILTRFATGRYGAGFKT